LQVLHACDEIDHPTSHVNAAVSYDFTEILGPTMANLADTNNAEATSNTEPESQLRIQIRAETCEPISTPNDATVKHMPMRWLTTSTLGDREAIAVGDKLINAPEKKLESSSISVRHRKLIS
jgi:hypothetical protein